MQKIVSSKPENDITTDDIVARACPVCLACLPMIFILLGVTVENSEGRLPI